MASFHSTLSFYIFRVHKGLLEWLISQKIPYAISFGLSLYGAIFVYSMAIFLILEIIIEDFILISGLAYNNEEKSQMQCVFAAAENLRWNLLFVALCFCKLLVHPMGFGGIIICGATLVSRVYLLKKIEYLILRAILETLRKAKASYKFLKSARRVGIYKHFLLFHIKIVHITRFSNKLWGQILLKSNICPC